ncbi:CASP8-associated protein 2 [Danio aesculapii]|uniref:CASP8-associated protein 2 n=1 Tax=Danio aesculapii TaxID=1142201 RepID=UPI0024C0D278|nr:CASP8-associated protein 2 [Danio aesculapii]
MDSMDELYGDIVDKSSGTPLYHSEDSVDIYSGLENSPKCDGHRVSTLLSPRTMESMDIYEEIIREEQEEKEATYNELKQKFDGAQKQVNELLSKLQLLQTKNSSLSTENILLKKNICSLIKTARMEIVRKDEEISRLSNRSGRGSYGHSFHQSQMGSAPANTRHTLNNSTCSVLESRGARQEKVTDVISLQKDRITSTSTSASQPFEVLQRCPRTESESPLQCQNKSAAKTDREIHSIQPQQEYGPVHPNSTSESITNPTTLPDILNTSKTKNSIKRVPDETTDCQLNNLKSNKNCPSSQDDKLEKSQKCTSEDKIFKMKNKDVSPQSKVDRNLSKPVRLEKELTKDNSVSSENRNQQPEVPVILKSSEQSHSSQSHKSLSSVSSHSSKTSIKKAADVETQSQGHMHKLNAEKTSKETRQSGLSSTECSVVNEEKQSQSHKGKKRDASGPERKEEKRSSAERRSSKPERSRDHEQKRPKDSDRSKRDEGNHCSSRERKSNRSESSRDHERRSTKGKDNKDQDKRSTKQVDGSDSRRAISSPKHDSQWKDVNKEKSSSRIDEASSKSKSSHRHDKSRKMVDLKYLDKSRSSNKTCLADKEKEKDRKRNGHLEDHRVEKHGESNKLITDDRKRSSKKHKTSRKCQDIENGQDMHLESVHLEPPSVVAVSSSPCKTTKDDSPDRKLSFMETLNLTLSPLKKQKPSSAPKEATGATSEDAISHNSRCSDAGEEFFVIDELKNSQNSVDEMDENPETTNVEDRTCLIKLSENALDMITGVTSEKPSTKNIEIAIQNENITENQETGDKVAAIVNTSEEKKDTSLQSKILDNDLVSVITLTKESSNCASPSHAENSPGTIDNAVAVFNNSPNKTSEDAISDSVSQSIVDGCPQPDLFATVSKETSQKEIQGNTLPMSKDVLLESNEICQENVSSSDKEHNSATINSSGNSDSSVNMEVSSSTVCADLNGPSKVICDFEQVDSAEDDREREIFENIRMIETQETSENLKISETSLQSPLQSENTEASIDGTSVEKETMSFSQPGFSEPDSTEKEEQKPKSSNSVVFCHDEDSMMLTLRNIRVIPEPISPLTSPVRQVKKAQPPLAEKQPHVKSLNKDLSIVTAGSEKDKVNMEMNKENKSPDSSVTCSSYNVTKDALSASGNEEDELEDGEIVSESEEEGPLFIQTPPREKDKSTSGARTSPKLSASGKRVPQKKSFVPAKHSERSKSSKSASANDSPTSGKRRFKTVSPPLKAAVYTLDGFMDMLGSIRHELRKKYMKLQKNVTKTAFCCIVEMSHASFTEFINAVDLDTLCCKGSDIKVQLNKIVSSIMSKVTKNGIVNRIFEQRAGDLKQKLWTFVDGQFDFLFKEIKLALKRVSEPSKTTSFENKNSTLKRKEFESETVEKEPFSTPGPLHIAKKPKVDTGNLIREALPHNLPRRGLGSRGKNIKAVMNEDNQPAKLATPHKLPTSSSERSVQECTSGSENRSSSYVRRLSHNGSIQDKSDFELLTEQQTSSLTFNLVSDSQMGEIFKCLLQGSDLLESSVPVGDNTSWPLSTPRKEGLACESLIGFMTPNKTPFKSITSWSSISPYKFPSNSKMLVDPAILDESCLLEVPSNSEPCQLALQSTVVSQRSFSILAEDLAVSLTIPSPLKSDSHLSFLHPGTGQPLSAPNSVLSAHYSEDALLDGEDATEQDIHLSLDTDNSSCGSSPSRTWEGSDQLGFQFQPNLPMQAVVMERSNDHFIVRIRRTSTSPNEGKAIPTLAKCPEPSLKPNLNLTHEDLSSAPTKLNKPCHISEAAESQPSNQKSSSEGDNTFCNNAKPVSKDVCFLRSSALEENSATEVKTSEKVSESISNNIQSSSAPESEPERVSRKRKDRQSESKSKRSKVEKSQEKHSKSRHKKKSKPSKEKVLKTATPPVSPSSLSAKNVIRKKGEVVVSWTRDEDRDILVELKMKGTSPKTFAALSKKLKKSTEQIEERFSQLMKLFKKKEKMEN